MSILLKRQECLLCLRKRKRKEREDAVLNRRDFLGWTRKRGLCLSSEGMNEPVKPMFRADLRMAAMLLGCLEAHARSVEFVKTTSLGVIC